MVELKHIIKERLQISFGKKLTMQRQTESAECGLACIAMIASYYGYATDVATLRKKFPLSLKGATLTQLVEVAGAVNMAPRPLRLDLEELRQLRLPCILHWNLDHFVVLKKVSRSGICIHDPAKGERRFSLAETSRHFTGVAVELTPAPGFQKKTERQTVSLWQMMGKVVGLKRSLIQVGLLALVLEAFTLAAPVFNQLVVDHAVVTADLNLLFTLAIGFGLLKVFSAIVEAVRGYAILLMSTNLNVQWLANLFTHLLRLPVDYFSKRHMGDVVSRFNSIHTIQSTLTTSFVGGILDGILAVGTITMMLIYSAKLSYICLTAAVLYILLRLAFYAALMAATENAVAQEATQQSIFMETVRGIQSIRLFSREKDRSITWLNAVVNQKNAMLRTQRIGLLAQMGNTLLFGIEEVAVVALGAKLVIDGEFSVGMLFAFLSYKSQFSRRVSSLTDKVFELKMLRFQGERLSDIALSAPEEVPNGSIPNREHLPASLAVENVTFSYGTGERPIFSNLSFTIEAGESVAIVGPSGCGKSTLLKLMLGINTPQAGEIKFGGISLRELGMSNYRSMIGTVMQEDSLFAGSIAENICFFAPEPSQQWIETCAHMAALHNEIMAMPMGYDTLIGDMGSVLSGGQKQRLLLARALYCKPKILFLDEATSHLDVVNERIITEVVRKLALTRIIVAHRSETIAGADRVITLQLPARPAAKKMAA